MRNNDTQLGRIPLSPGTWGYWLLFGTLYLIFVCISIHQARQLGEKAAKFLKSIAKKRYRVIEINVALAFPDLTHNEIADLAWRNFEQTCAGFFETAYVLLRGSRAVLAHSEVRGRHVLDEAINKGKNILLIGAHFTSMETCGTIMAHDVPMAIVHRHQNVAVANYLFLRNRLRLFTQVIHRDDGKSMLSLLQDTSTQSILWMAPDQDMGHQRSVYVPFLGVDEAATLRVMSRLVSRNDLTPLFLEFAYDEASRKWCIKYQTIPDYPSDDETADAATLNSVLGEAIKRRPDQYYWVHRRFKSLPDGSTRSYR